jgi:DNA-binding SARP family transcriptional activator/predicted ATPase
VIARLDISLLGQLKVTLDGQPVTRFQTDKVRALLAYLAVGADRVHRRTELAGLLWPDVPEKAARHSLSQALFRLRKALNDQEATPPFLLTTWKTLRFNPASDYSLDVDAFQAGADLCERTSPEQLGPADAHALTQSMALYRGKFLSTPLRIDSQAFEEWLVIKQTQFHLLALNTLNYLGQYHELRGEFGLAADYARRQIELESLHELAHRNLMLALAQDNRRAEALAHYATCRALLAKELGVAPAPETTALYERIRAAGEEATLSFPVQRREKPGTGPLGPPPITFVGRKRELASLAQALTLTLAGQGQVRFITGDAGSGKTALLRAFARQALAAHPDVLVVNGSGNAYTGAGDPYWPFIEILGQLSPPPSGGALDIAQIQRLAAVHSVVAPLLDRYAPDLVRLLENHDLESGQADLQQSHLFAQVTRALHALAAAHPLVLLLDDLQWADQDSINLLFHLGQRLADHQILIVGALRPHVLYQGYAPGVYLQAQADDQQHPLAALLQELQRRWGDIQLDLDRASGRAFIDDLIDAEPNHLDVAFRDTLYQHTAGHALFTTELLRELQVRGDVVRDAQGYWVAGADIAWDTLPARVEGVIAARVGQLLPEWQAILTVASVEGEEFTAEVVARVLDMDMGEVQRRLSGALSRHHYLVVPVGVHYADTRALARYRFRHVLFRQYLYVQLDPVQQARLHEAVGHALEALHADVEAIAARLAYHFEAAGLTERAVGYLRKAGRRAYQLSAPAESAALYQRGLTLLEKLPQTKERDRRELELLLSQEVPLTATRGWGAPERAETLQRAYQLGRQLGETKRLLPVLQALTSVYVARAEHHAAMEYAEQLSQLADQTSHRFYKAMGHRMMGTVFLFLGQYEPARKHLEAGLQGCAELQLAAEEAGYAWEIAEEEIRLRVWLAHALLGLGYPAQATTISHETLTRSQELGYIGAKAIALTTAGGAFYAVLNQPQETLRYAEQLLTLATRNELPAYHAWAVFYRGWARAYQGQTTAGISEMHAGLKQLEATGTQGAFPHLCKLLAETYARRGKVQQGEASIDRALIHFEQTGACAYLAEIYRVQGILQLKRQAVEEAEASFRRAIDIAREQSTRLWELRATMSLCRLYQATDQATRLAAARAQLAELYDWFTEGLDTADLQEAAALLEEMRGR